MLKSLGGRSLKEDTGLWQAWVQLCQARNSFVHEGRAMLGKKKSRNRTPLTRQTAREVVARAEQIIDFIEAFLPAEHRRSRLQNRVEVTVATMVYVAEPSQTS